jgi:hypothetical protein
MYGRKRKIKTRGYYLEEAVLIGHNIIGFDVPVLKNIG